MKILSIKLKNINSLRGETVIDFTSPPLRDSGLFAIIGATGSGKSTILDCITLALFNEVPRLKSISADSIRKGGLIVTRNETDSLAEVKYSCNHGVFISRWSVRRKRGSQNFDIPKMVVCDQSGTPLTDKNKEVIKFNEEKTGLSYDQFVKSIILCQGDFAKFLKSDKNDRAKLLEEITRTSDFRKLGKLTYEMYKKRQEVLGQKISYFKRVEEKLLDEGALTLLKTRLQDLGLKINSATDEIAVLEKKAAFRKQLEQLGLQVEARKNTVNVLGKKLQDFNNEHQHGLDVYKNLLPFKDKLSEYGRQIKNSEEAAKEIENLEKAGVDIKARLIHLLTEVSQWLGKEVSEHDYAEGLDDFREKITRLVNAKSQAELSSKQLRQKLGHSLSSAYLKTEQQMFNEQGDNNQLAEKLQHRIDAAVLKFEEFVKKEEVNESNVEEKRTAIGNMVRDLDRTRISVRDRNINKELLSTCFAGRLKKEDELQKISLRISDAEQQVNLKEGRFKAAEEARRKMLTEQSFDKYRGQLVEGKPCPLCGSEHHPYVHAYAKDLGDADLKYIEAENELTTARKILQQLMMDNNGIAKEISLLQEKIVQAEEVFAKLDHEVRTSAGRFGLADFENEEKVDEQLAIYKASQDKISAYQSFLSARPVFEQVLTDIRDHDQKCREMSVLQAEISALYKGNDIQADYREKRQSIEQSIQSRQNIEQRYNSYKEKLANSSNALRDIVAAIGDPLRQLGYDDPERARLDMLDEKIYLQLIGEQNHIHSDLRTAKELFRTEDEKLKEELAKDDPEFDLDSGSARVSELKKDLEGLKKEHEDVKLSLRTDQQFRKEIEDGGKEISDMRIMMRPWELLNELIGDATGNKFNERAQKLTLQHLLRFCNLRLKKLHSRYEVSMPNEDEDDDLVVTDTHMGNERRSVKTLSGGETFIISLALALGLSDLASRDIRIDSLFVDEGFGTLDSDTLEEAITTLEQLQAESNKMVGIISHVESLKERIFTQIRLDKMNSGYSTLSIYPKDKSTE